MISQGRKPLPPLLKTIIFKINLETTFYQPNVLSILLCLTDVFVWFLENIIDFVDKWLTL